MGKIWQPLISKLALEHHAFLRVVVLNFERLYDNR